MSFVLFVVIISVSSEEIVGEPPKVFDNPTLWQYNAFYSNLGPFFAILLSRSATAAARRPNPTRWGKGDDALLSILIY